MCLHVCIHYFKKELLCCLPLALLSALFVGQSCIGRVCGVSAVCLGCSWVVGHSTLRKGVTAVRLHEWVTCVCVYAGLWFLVSGWVQPWFSCCACVCVSICGGSLWHHSLCSCNTCFSVACEDKAEAVHLYSHPVHLKWVHSDLQRSCICSRFWMEFSTQSHPSLLPQRLHLQCYLHKMAFPSQQWQMKHGKYKESTHAVEKQWWVHYRLLYFLASVSPIVTHEYAKLFV